MLGRVSECTLLDSKLVAAAVEVTRAIMTCLWRRRDTGWGFEGDCVRSVIRRSDHRRPPSADTIACMTAWPERCDRPRLQQLGRGPGRRSARRSDAARPPTPAASMGRCASNAEVSRSSTRAVSTGRSSTARPSPPADGPGPAVKYEIDDCPPIVVLIARRQDGWLASWSLADAVIHMPLDPIEAADVVAEQLRRPHAAFPSSADFVAAGRAAVRRSWTARR